MNFVATEAQDREQSWCRGRCEAICSKRWYGGGDRCNFRGTELIEGHWVCGTHARALRLMVPDVVLGQVWLTLAGDAKVVVWRNERYVTMVDRDRAQYAYPDTYRLAVLRRWGLIHEPLP